MEDTADTLTPGPWVVVSPDEDDAGGFVIHSGLIDQESGQPMYDPIVWEMGGIDNEANARLIAAAPDLLAACKAAHNALITFEKLGLLQLPHEQGALNLIRAAIAKAYGETQ